MMERFEIEGMQMDGMIAKVMENSTSLNRHDASCDERDDGFVGRMDKSGSIDIVPLSRAEGTLSYQEFVGRALKY